MSNEAARPDREGTAAGVPYIAFAPATASERAPLVVALHLMDPPRSERAMAAALPLAGLDAWRAYVGLPMFGERAPAGGMDEIMRLGYEDALMNLIAPVVEQSAEELPAAVSALREQLQLERGPLALLGGSAGGAAVLLALVRNEVAVDAAVLVNPATRATATIEAGEKIFGVKYEWNDERRARAEQLDFLRRAPEIIARKPQVPLLFVLGADDPYGPPFLRATAELRDALRGGYAAPEQVAFVGVPGLGHALAEEPGVEPAPQTAGAAQVDREVTQWLRGQFAGQRG